MIAMYGKIRKCLNDVYNETHPACDEEILEYLELLKLVEHNVSTVVMLGTDYVSVGAVGKRLRTLVDNSKENIPIIIISESENLLAGKEPKNKNAVIIFSKSKKPDVLERVLADYVIKDVEALGTQVLPEQKEITSMEIFDEVIEKDKDILVIEPADLKEETTEKPVKERKAVKPIASKNNKASNSSVDKEVKKKGDTNSLDTNTKKPIKSAKTGFKNKQTKQTKENDTENSEENKLSKLKSLFSFGKKKPKKEVDKKEIDKKEPLVEDTSSENKDEPVEGKIAEVTEPVVEKKDSENKDETTPSVTEPLVEPTDSDVTPLAEDVVTEPLVDEPKEVKEEPPIQPLAEADKPVEVSEVIEDFVVNDGVSPTSPLVDEPKEIKKEI